MFCTAFEAIDAVLNAEMRSKDWRYVHVCRKEDKDVNGQ